MTQDNGRTWTHQDVEITVDEMGRFSYTLDEYRQHQDTLSAAQEAITSHKLAQARSETVSLNCLTRSGEPFIVRGIHLGTSRVLTTPQNADAHGDCYVDTSLIRTMLEQAIYHEEKARSIREQLVNTRVRTYGFGRMRSEDYPVALERLLTNHEEATEHAKTLEQPDA